LKIQIKVQSYSDIITNSSSELFTIKTDLSWFEFETMWEEALRIRGYDTDDETHHGTIYYDEDRNNIITINFPVMCNLNNDMYEWLNYTFGRINIKTNEN